MPFFASYDIDIINLTMSGAGDIMQIRQLLTFITVASTKNMAQAAVALNYSHSTIYTHLDSLEKEFSTKLYLRTPRGIELTAQGETLLQYAKQFVDLYDEALSALSGIQQTSIRISASESADVCFMHKLLQEYIHRYPSVEIEYAKMTVESSLARLASNLCDLSIVCEFNFQPEGVFYEYLGTLPLIFVTSPLHLSGSAGESEKPRLIGTMRSAVAVQMMQSIGQDFNTHFSALSNIGDLDTIKQLLYYSRGVALLPTMYVKKDLEDGRLSRFPSLMQEVYLDMFLVTPSKNRIGHYTQKLIDLAYDSFNPNHLSKHNFLRI